MLKNAQYDNAHEKEWRLSQAAEDARINRSKPPLTREQWNFIQTLHPLHPNDPDRSGIGMTIPPPAAPSPQQPPSSSS